jgi:periplasmic protein TonB
MSYLINNQQKVNDIIFKDRNKNYGAYAIRSAYGNTIFKSLALMFLGFGSIMSVAFYFSNRPGDQQNVGGQVFEKDSIYTLVVDVTPEKQPEPVAPRTPPTGGGSAGMSTVISNTAAVENNTTTEAGTSSVATTSTVEGTGPANATVASTPSTEIGGGEPVHIPDTSPEYEGGLKALYAFLASKLKYPDQAREIGKEGTVYVKFVVDLDGRVGNLKLLNNQGYGLDEEALRVVSLIPNFKTPGKVNGKPVKVYFQLPIKFRMN